MQDGEEECDADQGGEHEMPHCAHPNHQAVACTPTNASEHAELPGELGWWNLGAINSTCTGGSTNTRLSLQLLRSSYTLVWLVCRL